MHGLIFASLRDYLLAGWGVDAARRVFGDALYRLSEAYPDDEFVALLGRAGEETGMPSGELLRDFGAFTAETTFARLFRPFYDIAGGTQEFLLAAETRIHELVRATIPSATPPQLSVRPVHGVGVEIVYRSQRRLCEFLEGLAIGTARHYGEAVELGKHACMQRGDPECVYDVRIRPAAAG